MASILRVRQADGTWAEIPAIIGPQGPAGADGKTPVKGVDYFTEAEKSDMVNDVLAALPVWEGGEY